MQRSSARRLKEPFSSRNGFFPSGVESTTDSDDQQATFCRSGSVHGHNARDRIHAAGPARAERLPNPCWAGHVIPPSTSAPPSATASPSAAPIEPGPGTWQLSKPMSVPRTEFAAVELMNGKVLLIGGKSWPTADTATVDIFDPAANTITAAASIKAARNGHSATLLPNGKVLVAGGDSRHSIG